MMYARIFPDLLDSSLPVVEKRLEGVGRILFSVDPLVNENGEDADLSMQKIDLRSSTSPVLFLYLFHLKVSEVQLLLKANIFFNFI